MTIRIGALFFGGEYQSPIQYNSDGLALQFLQVFSLQFLFSWFLLTGLIYLFFKGLKAPITWKPVFISVAMVLFVMVIRGVVCLLAALTLPASYYPYDLSLGVRFDSFGAIYYPAEAVSKLAAFISRDIQQHLPQQLKASTSSPKQCSLFPTFGWEHYAPCSLGNSNQSSQWQKE